MSVSTFVRRHQDGGEAEEQLVALLSSFGISCHRVSQWKGNRPDLVAVVASSTGQQQMVVGIEVKRDMLATRTGNMALEYRNPRSDRPSGILGGGRSPVWVYCVGAAFYAIRMACLRKLFFEGPPVMVREVLKGGDGNASLRLYRLADILPYFVKLDNAEVAHQVLFGGQYGQQ